MMQVWQWLAELAWWLRLLMSILAFVGGAILAGWMLALVMFAFRREASKRLRWAMRLGGGTVAGLLVWLFLHFAPPGTGSGHGNGSSLAQQLNSKAPASAWEETPPPPLPPDQTRGPLAPAVFPAGKWLLRIKLLGPDSAPKFAEPDKYFAIVDAVPADGSGQAGRAHLPSPDTPLNASEVAALVKEWQTGADIEAVELHVTPYSTSLRHKEVAKLRRLLMEAKVRFDYPPDPDKPQFSRLVPR